MRTLVATVFLLISAIAAVSQTPPAKADSKPLVLGVVDTIRSSRLGENRSLNIYLPEGYDPSAAARYPVIYLLDGGTDEDFIHIVGLVQFNSFPWVNRLPPTIVVGITNVDRRRDLTYQTSIDADRKRYPEAGHSDRFIDFIEKELQPYIDKTYKTNASRMLIGESLGGLLAAEILLKRPSLFDRYIIVSPSLWWDDGSLLRLSTVGFAAAVNKRTDVYIGVGKEGLGPGETPHVAEVDANVLADKLKSAKAANLTVFFDYLPQEDHATVSHQAVFNAFRLLFPSTKSPDR
ncbi:MAG: alpha/beta hydrolase [Pyrinomonadaceae bacterium]